MNPTTGVTLKIPLFFTLTAPFFEGRDSTFCAIAQDDDVARSDVLLHDISRYQVYFRVRFVRPACRALLVAIHRRRPITSREYDGVNKNS